MEAPKGQFKDMWDNLQQCLDHLQKRTYTLEDENISLVKEKDRLSNLQQKTEQEKEFFIKELINIQRENDILRRNHSNDPSTITYIIGLFPHVDPERIKSLLIENGDKETIRILLREEDPLFLTEKKVIPTVTLNVGGQIFTTSKNLLCSVKSSIFIPMLSGKYKVSTDEYGRIFIDRNGYLFGLILDFLRSMNRVIPTIQDENTKNQFFSELDYYGLDPILSVKDGNVVIQAKNFLKEKLAEAENSSKHVDDFPSTVTVNDDMKMFNLYTMELKDFAYMLFIINYTTHDNDLTTNDWRDVLGKYFVDFQWVKYKGTNPIYCTYFHQKGPYYGPGMRRSTIKWENKPSFMLSCMMHNNYHWEGISYPPNTVTDVSNNYKIFDNIPWTNEGNPHGAMVKNRSYNTPTQHLAIAFTLAYIWMVAITDTESSVHSETQYGWGKTLMVDKVFK